MNTKLAGIAKRSAMQKDAEFHQLMHHFDKDALLHCYHALDGKAAVGGDGITKEAYGAHLEDHVDVLWHKLKTMSYRPRPAREVRIPKEGERKQSARWVLGISRTKSYRKGCKRY